MSVIEVMITCNTKTKIHMRHTTVAWSTDHPDWSRMATRVTRLKSLAEETFPSHFPPSPSYSLLPSLCTTPITLAQWHNPSRIIAPSLFRRSSRRSRTSFHGFKRSFACLGTSFSQKSSLMLRYANSNDFFRYTRLNHCDQGECVGWKCDVCKKTAMRTGTTIADVENHNTCVRHVRALLRTWNIDRDSIGNFTPCPVPRCTYKYVLILFHI